MQGELTCDFNGPIVTQYDFLQQKHSTYNSDAVDVFLHFLVA